MGLARTNQYRVFSWGVEEILGIHIRGLVFRGIGFLYWD